MTGITIWNNRFNHREELDIFLGGKLMGTYLILKAICEDIISFNEN